MAGSPFTRRALIASGTAALFTPSFVRAQTDDAAGVRRNATSFVAQDWRDHFDTLGKSAMRKKVGPDWTPTASMMERFPDYRYMPPGPDNPLGTHAMYLGWPAYIIHGTQDTRKIGRRSSDGCIGLYNYQIEELFALCPVGTQVRII